MDYIEQNFELTALSKDIDKFVGKTKTVSSYMHRWRHAIDDMAGQLVVWHH